MPLLLKTTVPERAPGQACYCAHHSYQLAKIFAINIDNPALRAWLINHTTAKEAL